MHQYFNLGTSKRKVVAGMIAVLFSFGLVTVSLPVVSQAQGIGQLNQIGNALSMLLSRSPGERSTGILIKTKSAKNAQSLADKGPRKRLLARSLPEGKGASTEPAPESGIAGLIAPPEPVFILAGPDFAPGLLPALGGLPFIGGGGGFVSSPGGSGGSSGGGSSGGGGTPGNPNPPITDPTSPVPEPQTWALMLLGMGLCGAALRRRKNTISRETDPSCGSSAH